MGTHPIFESDFDCLTEHIMALKSWLKLLNMEQLLNCTSRVNVYIGNESGDLDSVVSALTMAYASDDSSNDSTRHIPMMNFPADMFPIKTESAFALRRFGISAAELFFLTDELENLAKLAAQNRLDIVLVDHNNPVEALLPLASAIRLVVDHHKLVENSALPAAATKRIALVGSCSSLVCDWLRRELGMESLPVELCQLVAQTILIDTANFSPNQLVDQLDRDQYSFVTGMLPEWDRESEYEQIVTARFTIDGLTTRQLLLKDAKFVPTRSQSVFASTIHCNLDDFFRRDNFLVDLDAFYRDETNDSAVLLLMGTVSSGVNRGFGWYAKKLSDQKFSEKFRAWQDSVEMFKMGEYEHAVPLPEYAGLRTIAGSSGKVVSRKKAMPLFLPWFEQNF